jgi:toxin ParE1/3/4
MVKIIWTDSAIQDLNDIGEYISKNSIRYAEITVDKLFNEVTILEQYPYAGKITPEFEDETIRN